MRTNTIPTSAKRARARTLPRHSFTTPRPGKNYPLGVNRVYLEIKPPADLAYFARGGPTLPPFRKPSATGGYGVPPAGYI